MTAVLERGQLKRLPASPVTVINVKPYYIIMCGQKLLCDGEEELPLVFDTRFLAEACMGDCNFDDSAIVELELEQLAHKCRDRNVPFNSFILITNLCQLGID